MTRLTILTGASRGMGAAMAGKLCAAPSRGDLRSHAQTRCENGASKDMRWPSFPPNLCGEREFVKFAAGEPCVGVDQRLDDLRVDLVADVGYSDAAGLLYWLRFEAGREQLMEGLRPVREWGGA